MARKLRVEYSGAVYHVMNRGDRREPIFQDDDDRKCFLATLEECCEKTSWQVHAVCLMPNHFHLVPETPVANLVVGMKWFLGTYTSRFNRRHRCVGHLFSGRYKALIVDGSGNAYFRTVCDYVHLNPARAGLLTPEQPLSTYRWSSYPEYLKSPIRRPAWLRVDRLLGAHGIPRDSAAGRRAFAERIELRRSGEEPEQYRPIRHGWCYGDAAFRKELLEQMTGRVGENHYAEERRESDEEKARRILAAELDRLSWTADDLRQRPKGDPAKVRVAGRLREETTMSLKWIAGHLQMGAWTHVSNLLSEARRGEASRRR